MKSTDLEETNHKRRISRDELPGWRIGDSACSGLLLLLGSGSVLCPVGAPPDGPSRQCPERASGLASRPNQTGVCAADLDHETPALRHMLEEHLQHRWTLASWPWARATCGSRGWSRTWSGGRTRKTNGRDRDSWVVEVKTGDMIYARGLFSTDASKSPASWGLFQPFARGRS
jgi:hypothetical protein